MDSMYFEKLGLNRPPFEETTSTAFFYATSACKTVIQAVKNQTTRGGISLIKGPAGCGKSILAQAMVGELDAHARVLSLSVPPVSPSTGKNADIGGTENRGIEQVADQIVDIIAGESDAKCVVIVDQAQHLSTDDLIAFQEHIASADQRGLKLSIVLIADNDIDTMLRLPETRAITEALNRLGELTPLDARETENYIAHRLRAAGAKNSKLFARKAIRRVAEISNGVPRKINDIAKRAMHIAAESKESSINTGIITRCAASIEQAENQPQATATPVPETPTSQTPMPKMPMPKMPMPKMEARKVEGLVRQLQSALANVPIGVGGDGSDGDDQFGVVDALNELAQSSGEADARAAKLDHAVRRADETYSRLVDFAEGLSRIGISTDERIELLLTSLESAQQIHEELQYIGDQAQSLIGESQSAVADEHDKMLTQLEELSARREELSIIIDQFKNEQEEMLRDLHRAMSEKLEAIRTEADSTSTDSKRVLEDATYALKRAERNLKESAVLGDKVDRTLGDARHLEKELSASFNQIRQDLSAHRANADEATSAHEACAKATEAAKNATETATATTQLLTQLKTEASTKQEALEHTVADANLVADQINTQIELARKELDERHEAIQQRIRQAGDGIQERLAAGVTEVGRLSEAAQDRIEQATQTIDTRWGKSIEAIESASDKATGLIQSLESQANASIVASRDKASGLIQSLESHASMSIESSRDEASELIQSSRDAALDSIQEAGRAVDARIAEGLKRFEQIMAAEEAASKRAAEATAHASAMMTRVAQSEAKLAETQQSVIDVEAIAAETLASVQARLKKMQDAVNVIVDQGASRAQAVVDESLVTFQDEALHISESLRKAGEEVQAQMQSQAQDIQQSFDAKQRAAQETIEQVAVSVDEIATDKVTDTRETIGLIAVEAQATLEQQQTDLIKTVDGYAADCDARIAELVATRTAHTERKIQDQTDEAITAIQEVTSQSNEKVRSVAQEIDKKAHTALVSLEDTAITTSEQAEKRVNNAALAAAKAIQDKIGSATETVRILDEAIVSGNAMVTDADERREKINQLIQEVWSLTSTTDHRVRSLESLSVKAKECEDHIGALVDQAGSRMIALGKQNETAEQHSNMLASQRDQIDSVAGELDDQLAHAKMLHAELTEANAAGKQIEASMAAHAEEIQELVATAETIVQTIREDDERAAQISATVKHSASVAENVEVRLNELQQSLADPISTIQNARAQADELNELCLAVKRIFRGVSQASLDANERIKMMGKMLTATHKTAETMKQWVAEAEHSRERLEAAIRSAPSINDTHPMTAMPDSPELADCMPSPVGASDIATVTKIAQSAPPASTPTSAKAKAAGKSVKFSGPESVDAEDRMEPSATVKRANLMSVASNGKKAPEPDKANDAAPAKRNRLSPEDVRSLIEAAKNKSAVAG